MKSFISTKVHGVLDYASAVLMIASPWLFGFEPVGGAALFLPIVLGAIQFIMVIFTRHELGMYKVVPIQLHLIIDMFLGFILLVSPFLYGFYHIVFLPHVIFGLLLIGAGIFTSPSPFLDKLDVLDPRGL
jgi:hypothetical protein